MSAQPRSARDRLRAALVRLRPELPAGAPDALSRVPRSSRAHDELMLSVETGGDYPRVLLSGQIGVGKSTELRQFSNSMKAQPSHLVVHCDLEKEMSPERCGALGVLLAMFRDAWAAYVFFKAEHSHTLARRTYDTLIEWLRGQRKGRDVVFEFGGMSFPISDETPLGKRVHIVLGKAAQHEALAQRRPDEGLPDKLVAQFNDYLDHLRKRSGRTPLLLVDHVDKIRDPAAAEQTFVAARSHWNRLRAGLIFTAPFERMLGPMRGVIEDTWGRPVIVYPEVIPDLGVDAPMPDFYKWMRAQLELDDGLGDDELRLLAHYSGGLPRAFVLLLGGAIRAALFADDQRVTRAHVERTVDDAESDYRDFSREQLQKLDELERTQQGLAAVDVAPLLRSPIALLVQANHELRIHPLALRRVERLRRRLAASA